MTVLHPDFEKLLKEKRPDILELVELRATEFNKRYGHYDRIHDKLINAFIWGETPEDSDFWVKVDQSLKL